MLSIDYIKNLVIVSIVLSTITCSFIQKTKILFKTNKFLIIYSLIVNIIFSFIFCYSFTNIQFPTSIWTGLFSFIGADTIYKSLEGRLSTHKELRKKKNHNE